MGNRVDVRDYRCNLPATPMKAAMASIKFRSTTPTPAESAPPSSSSAFRIVDGVPPLAEWSGKQFNGSRSRGPMAAKVAAKVNAVSGSFIRIHYFSILIASVVGANADGFLQYGQS